MRDLENVYGYLRDRDISFDICDTADSDNMHKDQVFILGTGSDLPQEYVDGLEKTIEAQDMIFAYGDEFLIDYEGDNKAYYLQDYHGGYNFIVGDGYVIGEDADLSCFEASDIVSALIHNMDGNIGVLPPNGNIFDRLSEMEGVHTIDLVQYCNSWNKYDAKTYIEKLAKNKPNWYFIKKDGSGMEVLAIRKDKI